MTIDEAENSVGEAPSLDPVADRRNPRSPSSSRSDRRAALAIGCLLLGVFWLTMGGHTYSVDDETYLAGTRALFNHTTVLNPGSDMDGVVVTVPNKNGDLTTIAPIGALLLFAPGFAAGKVAAAPFPVASQEEIVRLFFGSANSLFTAITAVLLFFLCRRLGAGRRSAVILALAFGLGTWAWPHSQTSFSEPGTAMLLTASMLALTRWWRIRSLRAAAVTGLLCGCTVLTRSSTMLFLPVFFISGLSAVGFTRQGLRNGLAFCAGGVLPGVAFGINAWLRFGSPFDLGYPPLPYSTPIYEGVFGLLMSPGKGILLYAPITVVVLFALRQAYLLHRRYTLTVGAIVLAHLAVYGRFDIWSGENAFGPRYLVPILPLVVALLAPVIDTGRQWVRAATVAGIIGFLVPGLLGSTMYFNAVYYRQSVDVLANADLTVATPTQQFLLWNFQPRSSPLMLQLRSVPDLVHNTVDRIQGEPGGITPIPLAYEERIHWYARAIELDTWWAWWPAKDGPGAIYLLLAVPLGLLAAGVVLADRERRSAASARGPALGLPT